MLTTHAMGATLLPNGAIELALDRILGQDDGRGLGQGVTDSIAMTVTVWLFKHSPIKIHPVSSAHSVMVNYPPMVFVSKEAVKDDVGVVEKRVAGTTAFLRDSLPANVHIQALRARSNDIRSNSDIILRFVLKSIHTSTSSTASRLFFFF